MATWGDVKAQARRHPRHRPDRLPTSAICRCSPPIQYGNFIPEPVTGFPQVVMAGPPHGPGLGTPRRAAAISWSTGDDGRRRSRCPTWSIWRSAPAMPSSPTSRTTRFRTGRRRRRYRDRPRQSATATRRPSYDNELLDAHFVAGDGRANENIGLTAVHHVFHSEHNRLVDHTKAVVLADAAASCSTVAGAAWRTRSPSSTSGSVDDVASVPASAGGLSIWDGERLFQAAKFGTEMQYQHLVFEEFARKIQPNINVFLVPDGFDVTLDPSIVAEFAHVVYRFGHSMLTETIDRFDPTFNADHIGLIEGFLNPLQFRTTAPPRPSTPTSRPAPSSAA